MQTQYLLVLLATLVVSGCEATRGGGGMTTAGEPIVAEIRQGNDLRQSVSIRSVQGWQCLGYLTNKQRNNIVDSVIQVPLKCSNGVTGTSLVSVDRLRGKANINFKLSNGVVGNAKIG